MSSGSPLGRLREGWAFRAVAAPGRVRFSAVRALSWGSWPAIEDGLEISTLGALGIGASRFSLYVVKRAKGAGRCFLFSLEFDMSELPALFKLCLG